MSTRIVYRLKDLSLLKMSFLGRDIDTNFTHILMSLIDCIIHHQYTTCKYNHVTIDMQYTCCFPMIYKCMVW